MSTQIQKIAAEIVSLEKTVASLRALLAEHAEVPAVAKKPRAENAWIEFNKRIDALMKVNSQSFLRGVTEAKQFASHLKGKKEYDEWEDAEISAECHTWLTEHPPCCLICKKDPTGDVESHRACIVSTAKEVVDKGKKVADPIALWMRLTGMKPLAEPAAAAAPPSGKKPGRPKMTEAEKAAAKAARDAKKAAE
jgi:hypothetical protein